MDLTEYFDDIVVGIIGSILASVIMVYLQRSRTDTDMMNGIGCDLEFAADSIYAACNTDDTSMASFHISRAMDYIQKAWVVMKSRNRPDLRFIFTITYSIYRDCSICLNDLATHDGDPIGTIVRHHLGDTEGGPPFSYLLLRMLNNLNYGDDLVTSCRGTIVPSNASSARIEYTLLESGCVDPDSFRKVSGRAEPFNLAEREHHDMRDNCFTESEYRDYVQEMLFSPWYRRKLYEHHLIRR